MILHKCIIKRIKQNNLQKMCLNFDRSKFEKMYREYKHSGTTNDSSECEIEIFKILVTEIQTNKLNINNNFTTLN